MLDLLKTRYARSAPGPSAGRPGRPAARCKSSGPSSSHVEAVRAGSSLESPVDRLGSRRNGTGRSSRRQGAHPPAHGADDPPGPWRWFRRTRAGGRPLPRLPHPARRFSGLGLDRALQEPRRLRGPPPGASPPPARPDRHRRGGAGGSRTPGRETQIALSHHRPPASLRRPVHGPPAARRGTPPACGPRRRTARRPLVGGRAGRRLGRRQSAVTGRP